MLFRSSLWGASTGAGIALPDDFDLMEIWGALCKGNPRLLKGSISPYTVRPPISREGEDWHMYEDEEGLWLYTPGGPVKAD